MKMKGISKIVIVVDDEYRQNVLKALNKIKADVLSIKDEDRGEDRKAVAIYALVKEKKFWRNRKKLLKFGDVAIVN